MIAESNGRFDLAATFSTALRHELAAPPENRAHQAAMIVLLENNGPRWLKAQLRVLIKAAENEERDLHYPEVWDTPEQH